MEEIGSFVSIIRTDEARIEGILGEVDLPNQRIVVKNASRSSDPTIIIQGWMHNTRITSDQGSTWRSFCFHLRRNFPSLSQRRTGARNTVDGPSFSEIVKGEKN
ncbi:hypothetical protein HID58_001006 [Brassica napus]|uniref:Lsm14-like N-terminal domain-containing protein n=1 Tax=Brassica napus TaxID=3708 RepID=A0ABQ8EI60_BRANA|nr:hypothetical protein HID58_001006 [Brassica napus]